MQAGCIEHDRDPQHRHVSAVNSQARSHGSTSMLPYNHPAAQPWLSIVISLLDST